ncbi:HNH endonuclease [Streptomyces sp. NPDC054887]
MLQEKVAGHGIDTSHFRKQSPWRKYTDEAIAAAVASSTTLREVVAKLGATPATGTMAHIGRRIAAAGIDTGHFPGMSRASFDTYFTTEELATAAASADSVRGVARRLGVADDSRSRAALAALMKRRGVDTAHFRNARPVISEQDLRTAVPAASSFADVVRALGLVVNDTNHRRVRRRTAQLGLDTSHFTRRAWGAVPVNRSKPVAANALVVLAPGSARPHRTRLHRALQEIGVPYRCSSCGNGGEWLGQPMTLQIDHINGDWLDNRPGNLRYLCPNCHALTATWCRNRRRRTDVTEERSIGADSTMAISTGREPTGREPTGREPTARD